MTMPARPAPTGREVEIRPAVVEPDVAAVRLLFREYAAGLGIDLGFEGFEAEVRSLPGLYAAPGGILLLAQQGREPVGCAGVRPFGPGECELKRLYLRPGVRGHGLGRALVRRALDFGETAGYQAMRLDTLPSMTEALRLYPSMGFVEVPEYWPNPVPGTRYFQRELEARTPPRGTSK